MEAIIKTSSFYDINHNEIENLNDFESEEELYLVVVINHTYGRSQLYGLKDFKRAERFLNISKDLVLQYKDRYQIELSDDVWYIQSLQHLLTICLTTKDRVKTPKIISELKSIDEGNQSDYEREEKEIKRIQKYQMLMATAYLGMGLILLSIIYSFFTESSFWYFGRIGQLLALVGLAGAYFFKDRTKDSVLKKIED